MECKGNVTFFSWLRWVAQPPACQERALEKFIKNLTPEAYVFTQKHRWLE